MSEAEWKNGDEPHLRKIFGYLLRDHVAYQDGRHSDAPSLLFSDYDYEVGDGVCGVHADGKRCGEPAIVYVRADALVDALERADKAEAWNRDMVLKAASGGVLDGYREMGAKLAAAEMRAEKAKADARDAYARGMEYAAARIEAAMYPNAECAKIIADVRAHAAFDREKNAALNRETE